MADEPSGVREAFDELLAKLTAKVEFSDLPKDTRELLQKTLLAGRVDVLSQLRSGKLTASDWPAIEAEVTGLVRAYTELPPVLSREQIETMALAALAEQMKNRQATRTPNWSAFYAKRAEIDRMIQDRSEPRA